MPFQYVRVFLEMKLLTGVYPHTEGNPGPARLFYPGEDHSVGS